MTGFGKSVAKLPNKKITVELKSLNGKQFDLSMKLPAVYREKELELRNIVARRLERGKVDMTICVETIQAEPSTAFNTPVLAQYKKQIERLTEELSLPAPADMLRMLLRLPDAIKTDLPAALEEEESRALFAAAEEAIEALMQYRRKEGEKLESFFAEKIANIRCRLDEIAPLEQERVPKIRARIEESLAKIGQVDYDKSRLEQEMIYYIEKLDVHEEMQRLVQHLEYFMETMASKPGQGKKLGFISQEMGREINTLGSKSNHAGMQKIVVKMKDELEQIKEQVLNVM